MKYEIQKEREQLRPLQKFDIQTLYGVPNNPYNRRPGFAVLFDTNIFIYCIQKKEE